MGPAIGARVEAKVAAARVQGGPRRDRTSSALAFASLGVGIPISGIALGATDNGATGLVALLIAWTGIAAVNVVHNRGS